MSDLIVALFPNLIKFFDRFLSAIGATLIMVGVSAVISIVIGTLLGILLVVTAKGKLYENLPFNNIAGKLINILRAIPFVILITLLLPVTKFIVGTSIGVKGAIVPLVIGNLGFTARLVEQGLAEVDNGIIEAARSMGLSKPYIIWHILLKEGTPGLARGYVMSIVNLINTSAMAGTVGGGGLGDFAIRYGYTQYMQDITIVTVVLLLLFVMLVQAAGDLIVRKSLH